jgi:integrase
MSRLLRENDGFDDGWEPPRFAAIPFSRFRTELLNLYVAPLRAKRTLDKVRHVLDQVARLIGPDATTADLTPQLIGRFIQSQPATNSPHTTLGLLRNIATACAYAKSCGYLQHSPFEFRKVGGWLRASAAQRKRHHSQEDIRRVLGLLAAEILEREGWSRWRARRLQALVSTIAYTGIRRDEALNLQVEDIDLNGRMILLVERSQRLKTEMSAQPVPLPPAVVPILESWLAYRTDGSEGLPDCPFLFPGVRRLGPWKGGPPGLRPIDQIKAAGERAGVQGLTFLSLRHSYATHAESWGLSPAMIQRVLRHSSLQTQKHYRHADLANMRSAVDGIEFANPPAPPATDGGPAAS